MSKTKSGRHRSPREQLDSVKTLAELQAYAEGLYASGELDASEQMTTSDPDYGWLAPWSVPPSAEVLDDRGEDVTIRFPSGELARWNNSRREWASVADIAHTDLASVDPLKPFHLERGGHAPGSGQACVNELGSILAGEPWGYRLQCQDRIIGDLLVALNDRLDEGPRQLLAPLMLRSLGSANDGREEERQRMLNEWMLHQALPLYLDLAGCQEAAQKLRGLPADLSVEAVRQAIRSARDEVWDARRQACDRLASAVRASLFKLGAAADAIAVAAADAADAIAAHAADGAADAVVEPYSSRWSGIRDAVYKELRGQLKPKVEEIVGPLNDQLLPGLLGLLDRMLPAEPQIELAVPLEQAKIICGAESA